VSAETGTTALRVKRRAGVRFAPIQQQRAHEYVAEQIRRHIGLRLVAPGDPLPSERELASMFGVGRPTVQLALRQLEADHLIESRRGRSGGSFVTRPASDDAVMEELILRLLARRDELDELLDYRRAVEPAVARLAARSRGPADLERMRAAIAAMRVATSEPDYMRFDTEFHLAVAAAARNRYLARAIEEIRLQLADAISLLPESETWHQRISGEHERISDAIEAGAEAAAQKAADIHVEHSERSVRAVLAAIRRQRLKETR
jgi:GntR family transcriptional regulator, transcriptional repressor for pyruvate dehydrogenase complex